MAFDNSFSTSALILRRFGSLQQLRGCSARAGLKPRPRQPGWASEQGAIFYVGVVPRDQDPAAAAPNHSPNFYIDEKALVTGVRALAMVSVNYLANGKPD